MSDSDFITLVVAIGIGLLFFTARAMEKAHAEEVDKTRRLWHRWGIRDVIDEVERHPDKKGKEIVKLLKEKHKEVYDNDKI